jgi:hypothetical protein
MNRIMQSNEILSRSEQSFVSASIDYELCPATRNGKTRAKKKRGRGRGEGGGEGGGREGGGGGRGSQLALR